MYELTEVILMVLHLQDCLTLADARILQASLLSDLTTRRQSMPTHHALPVPRRHG